MWSRYGTALTGHEGGACRDLNQSLLGPCVHRVQGEERWRGGLDGAVVTYVDGAFGHPGVNIILHMEVGASEDVHTKSGHNQAREMESLRTSREGCVDLPKNRKLGLAINLYSTVTSFEDLEV